MKTKRVLVLALCIVFLTSGTSAAGQEGVNAIFMGSGYLLVCNWPGLYFSLEVKGKKVKPLPQTEHVFFEVDGIVLQVQGAAISDFVKDIKDKRPSDQEILAAHRDWESDYVGSALGKKLKVESSPQKLPNGTEALLWKFAMPDGFNCQAKTQMYLAIVSKDHVLLLNGVVDKTMEDADVQKYLLDTAATIKISAEPIDVKKLSEAIKKGNPN